MKDLLSALPASLQTLLRMNLNLFPITPGAKRPAHNGWQREAAHGLGAQIAFWSKNHTQYNIGIATGLVVSSNSTDPAQTPSVALLVLDFDRAKGGLAAMQTMLQDKAHALPPTFCVHTRDGGYHFYYYYPAALELGNRANWKQGVDIRAQGGLVVGPGSHVPGSVGVYSICKDKPIAKAPKWLIKALYSPPQVEPPQLTPESPPDLKKALLT